MSERPSLADLLHHATLARASRLARIRSLTSLPLPRGYHIPSRLGGATLLCHPCPHGPAPWRVTWLDASGAPAGHVDASSASGALMTAYELGGDIEGAEALP